MKKGMVLLTGFLLAFSIFVIGCGKESTTTNSIQLSVDDTNIQTDETITATIQGKTEPNAKVEITYDPVGMGYEEDIKKLETTANSDGNFSQDVDWQTDYTLIAKKGNNKSKKVVVTVTHSDAAKQTIDKNNTENEQNYKDNAKSISYQMLNKNADTYADEPYYIKGKVVQAIEESDTTMMRVNVTEDENGYYDDTMAVIYDGYTDAVENDIIEAYGTIYGNYTYKTTIGGEMRIPGLNAKSINIIK
ncbi:DUF4969 domain-containing protein [Listeria monocytogenes]|uniref:DUF4969 domain-containing protein n=1 Tax=Listeria monocytogenes TaxID=1639 RepID=UPI0008750034|nr:DUF4969 domain-containing protein [Listeria monocytogenes]EAD9142369.1 DUF4969 domain-containing protein [Listeria monocytogenes]EAE5924556.1 DUF4969 domain-containing protein [Listeria monocytogenes]EAE5997127.1 DUF4969 domain-containing protein [Listeria monocytogenes]EAF1515851.1 DUF4969 domain-containing protein [Listeria monocytogenes]EAF1554173.1 DUF4969 domain-containing protein [Listeria monocytogenes]